MSDILNKAPLLRICLPFLFGIVFFKCVSSALVVPLCALGSSFCLYMIFAFLKKPIYRIEFSFISNFAISLFAFGLGGLGAIYHAPAPIGIDSNQRYIAKASISNISTRDNSTHADLVLHWLCDSTGESFSGKNTKVRAFIEGSNYSLADNDTILVSIKLNQIISSRNPEEFDYSDYYFNRGILYSSFIKRNEYQFCNHGSCISTWSSNCQQKIISRILSSRLSPDAQSFYTTIVLGDKSFIDYETRIVMAQAGIAHILALSGLHVGIIFLIISFVLIPLDFFGYRSVRLLFSLIAIIAFGFVVGMPLSVFRAIIMIGFVILSKLLFRQSNSLNALAAAFLVITVISPFSIFDIGFQLSFLSVLCIILISNNVNIVSPKRVCIHFIVSSLIVSVSASLGSSILTAYYFNMISTVSAMTNLLISPFLPLVIGCAIFYIIALCFGIDSSLLQCILEFFHSSLLSFSKFLSSLPFSHFDNLYVSQPIILFYILVLFSFFLLIIHKDKFYIYLSVITSTALLSILTIQYLNYETDGYLILNHRDSTPICWFSNNSMFVFSPDEEISPDDFSIRHKRLLSRLHINSIQSVNSFHKSNSLGCLFGKTFAVINDRYYIKHRITPKLSVDYLIITKRYHGPIKPLLSNFSPAIVILSGDIFPQRLSALESECRRLHINFHSLRSQGAIYDFFR